MCNLQSTHAEAFISIAKLSKTAQFETLLSCYPESKSLTGKGEKTSNSFRRENENAPLLNYARRNTQVEEARSEKKVEKLPKHLKNFC